MYQEKTISIIEGLANGIDPITGEVLPNDSPYNHPEVIRALFHVISLIPKVKKPKRTIEQKQEDNIQKGLPKNFGLPWNNSDVQLVINNYNTNVSIEVIANQMFRKASSIIGLLKKHGVISEDLAFTLGQKFK